MIGNLFVGMEEKVNQFHRHLDECRRCREDPFNLCDKGETIMQDAVGAQPPAKSDAPR